MLKPDEYNSPSGVSYEEHQRRRAILERDRAAALIMEPGIPEFHGPGAVAGEATDALVGAQGGGKDAVEAAASTAAERFLWTTVWEDLTGLSLIGLNILAFKTGMKGWAIWKKFALIALNLLGLAIAAALGLVVVAMLCLGDSDCRGDLFGAMFDDLVDAGLSFIKGLF